MAIFKPASSKPFLEFLAKEATGGTQTTVNNHAVVAFSGTIYYEKALPTSYAGNGLVIEIEWAVDTDTDTAHRVGFDVSFMRHVASTDRYDVDSYATAQSVSNLAWTSILKIMNKTSITFTNAQIDNLAAGEMFTLKVTRTGSMTGNVLVGTIIGREP